MSELTDWQRYVYEPEKLRYKSQIKACHDKLEAQAALIAELVEAIRPFANDPSDWEVEWVDVARAALSKAKLATTAEKSV